MSAPTSALATVNARSESQRTLDWSVIGYNSATLDSYSAAQTVSGCRMSVKGFFYVEAFESHLDTSKKFYGETLGWKLNTDLPKVAGFFFGTGYLVLVLDNRPHASRQYAGGMYVEVQVEDAT